MCLRTEPETDNAPLNLRFKQLEMTTDILLTHGYFIAEDEHEQQIMKPYPTLGLLYISSHLKAKGFDVDLFDATFESLASFATHMERTRPTLVGIYCNLMTKFNVLKQIALCKAVGATVVLGGPEPASYAQEYLTHGADFIIVGEGELTLEALLPHLKQHGRAKLEEIAGLIYRNDGGEITRTPPRPQIDNLSAQPWPDRAAIDMQRYLDTWKTHHGLSSVSLITARGCPYTCTWCSHSVFGQTHRRRTVEDVADEVEWIIKTYAPDQLWYADDVFTIQPRWTLNLAAELQRRGIRIPFECISRADRLNEAVIAALAEMGCYRLWLGAESGSQRILDAMKRKTDAADVQKKSHMLQAAGIQVGMFIMLGYEGEELTDIWETAEHLKQSNPDTFLTTVAYPIKGTPYYDDVQDRIDSPLAWAERADRDMIITGRRSPTFYKHATRWMVSDVNLHKALLERQLSPFKVGKLFIDKWRGRFGMYQTRNHQIGATGTGWTAEERATQAW